MPSDNRTYKEGEFLMHQNENSRHMFIIKKGKVKVFRKQGQYLTFSKIVGEGGLVGGLSLMDGHPRDVSARCLTEVEVTLVRPEEFDNVTESLPTWLKALSRSLAHRIRNTIEKTERNPKSYLKSSVVSVLSYFCVENEEKKFNRDKMISQLADILRVDRMSLQSCLEELQRENILILSNENLEVPEGVSLEEWSARLRREMVETGL